MLRNSSLGLMLFVVTGLIITAILAGDRTAVPSSGMLAYFLNGDSLVAHRSIDLSKPIFVSGATPVCGSEEALENYTPANPGDCKVIDSAARAGLIAIQTDGMRQPSFQMQMQTDAGTVRGWVDYNSLHN
ncbi:hypothetical protein [Acidisoma sp. 7E03]